MSSKNEIIDYEKLLKIDTVYEFIHLKRGWSPIKKKKDAMVEHHAYHPDEK